LPRSKKINQQKTQNTPKQKKSTSKKKPPTKKGTKKSGGATLKTAEKQKKKTAQKKNSSGKRKKITEKTKGKKQRKQEHAYWFLDKISLLKDLSTRDLEQIQKNVELLELQKRVVVYLPGDPGENIFFVNGGRVKISKVTRDGREITLMYLGPGEVFGENCLFNESPRREMVETSDNSIISVIPKTLIEKLMKRQPKFLLNLFEIVSRRRQSVEDRVQHLLFRDVSAKLAELILDLSEKYGVAEDDGTRIAMKITHQEMANLIGSTRETVSLTLSQFRKQKLLRLHKRQVIILDLNELRALL